MKTILRYTAALMLSAASLSNVCFAQDFKADMAKMQKIYNEATTMHIKVNVKTYNGSQSSDLVTTQTADLKRIGNEQLTTIDGQSVLMNNKYMVMINHDEQIIILEPIDKQQMAQTRAEMQSMIPSSDEMIKAYDKVEYKGTSKGLKHYHIKIKSGPILTSEIFIDEATGLLAKVEYNYDPEFSEEASRVVMTYTKMDLDPNIPKQTFSESNWVRKKGGQWVASAKYPNYRIQTLNLSSYE